MENKEIDTCKLLYNTERVRLYIPEYGRNVQKMVNYLKTVEDRQKRNEQARAIIKVMEILNPSVHLEEDFEHKLWDHLFIISGFDLDIDAPYPMPSPEILVTKPEPVPVNTKPIKATHYGRNIESIIELIYLQHFLPSQDDQCFFERKAENFVKCEKFALTDGIGLTVFRCVIRDSPGSQLLRFTGDTDGNVPGTV